MDKGAKFSECGKYRYVLWRIWDEDGRRAMCIGLNPSTANSDKDDPTIRLLINTLTDLGFGGLYMVNLYALISSKPSALAVCADPIKDNDKYIQEVSQSSNEVIFCWGSFKSIEYRAKKMVEMFPAAKCFDKTAGGSPWHPLALMYAGVKRGEASLKIYATPKLVTAQSATIIPYL